jgi:hypothetical protein
MRAIVLVPVGGRKRGIIGKEGGWGEKVESGGERECGVFSERLQPVEVVVRIIYGEGFAESGCSGSTTG